jgi:hypothetical protein
MAPSILVLLCTIITILAVEAEFIAPPSPAYLPLNNGGQLPTVEVRLSKDATDFRMLIEREGIDVTTNFVLSGLSQTIDTVGGTNTLLGFNFELLKFDLSQVGTYNFKFLLGQIIAATSKPFTIEPLEPLLLVEPTNQIIYEAPLATLTATIIGKPPLEYRWDFQGEQMNGSDRIQGIRTNSLIIQNPSQSDAGEYVLRVFNRFGAITTRPAILKVGYTWESWRAQIFDLNDFNQIELSSPEADPDGDGYKNLAEYAFGLQPRQANSSGIISIQHQFEDGISYVTCSFPIRKSANDIRYRILSSTDLLHWSEEYWVNENDFNPESITIKTVKVPFNNQLNLFLQVEVSLVE